MKNNWKIALSIACGALIGGINGFLGAGGGMLLVPLLQYVLGLGDKKSHATAVFVILPISLISGITYAIKGVVDWGVLLPVAIGTLVGGIIGTFLMKKLGNETISFIFWIVMIASGVWIIISNI